MYNRWDEAVTSTSEIGTLEDDKRVFSLPCDQREVARNNRRYELLDFVIQARSSESAGMSCDVWAEAEFALPNNRLHAMPRHDSAELCEA